MWTLTAINFAPTAADAGSVTITGFTGVGFTTVEQVTINGQPAPLAEPHQFQEKEGRLILKLSGQPMVEVGL